MKLRSSKETSFSILLPTTRKRKAEENKLIEVPSKKKTRFYDSYYRQNWSLRDSLIHYITQNPSSAKVYQKIIQSCKYFFFKNPILIVSDLSLDITCKIWITNEINIIDEIGEEIDHNFLASLIPKIYQSDVKTFNLCDQNLFFDELIFLASNAETIRFDGGSERTFEDPTSIIKNADGSFSPLEKIFAALPKVKKFYYTPPSDDFITTNTVKELLKISHFSNLDYFRMVFIPVSFDIETFYDYIKGNKKTRIYLLFSPDISEAYKTRLQTIVNEILQTQTRDFKVPYISFDGSVIEDDELLWDLFLENK
uniref:Uncharacterized protein n=1 Tax=Panagrolaimus davidi TaxID=227884 RepID=A0A914P6W2_9BILA